MILLKKFVPQLVVANFSLSQKHALFPQLPPLKNVPLLPSIIWKTYTYNKIQEVKAQPLS